MTCKALNSRLLVLMAFSIVILAWFMPTLSHAQQPSIEHNLCGLTVSFANQPKIKQQTLKLSETVTMEISNALAVNDSYGAIIATNISCQQLAGASYTGSAAEWAKFFNSANQGLINSGYKDIAVTFVGANDALVADALAKAYISKEYDYRATVGSNKQLIKNLALLDKANNTLYTLSVSGSRSIESNVRLEFERLLASIKKVSTAN
jgi:hypothetical protein